MLANSEIQILYAKANNNHNSPINKNLLDKSIIFNKIKIINFLVLLIVALIIIRIIYLNTFNNNFLAHQLNVRIMRNVKIPAMRGNIVDRNNNPLAISTPIASIWVDPTQLDNLNTAQIDNIANILHLSVANLNNKLKQKNKTFVYLKRSVSPLEADAIKDLDIEGIYSIQEFKRYYPYANVTAHVVGFNNIDDNGAEGIEYIANKKLIGIDGKEQIARDRQGHVIKQMMNNTPAINGKNIQLSIDNKIQFIVYDALQEQVKKFNAKGGSAVVLDAKTGEVLAMVNMPNYNPNDRKTTTLDAIRNRAAIDIYEPGSIIKPLLVAKALNDNLINPNTIFDTRPYYVGKKLIQDDHPHPVLDVTGVIQKSSDVGASKIALKLTKQEMWQYYSDLGFGHKVGTGFPGEATGILRNWKKWYPIDQAEMGFGYAISVSLLQMARSYSIFTNNGCLLPVTFYKNGNNDIACKQVISNKNAQILRSILAGNTTDGTGHLAQTNDYTTAGKTGTAQKYKKGYSGHAHYSSFVGFAPAITDPKLIIAVTIDEPTKTSYYGGVVAAPAFAKIANATLHELNIAPDKK